MYSAPDMNNPVDKLAHWMSEVDNDNAPLGWEKYRNLARFVIDEFELEEAVKNITV